jgi:hypothetical protein
MLMRRYTMFLWRLSAVLMLISGSLTMPVLDGPSVSVVAKDNGKDQDKADKKEEKKKDKEEKEREKQEKKDNKKEDRGNGNVEVANAEGYFVEVQCEFDPAAGTTTCSFTGVAPEGAKDVGHVDLPADEVCAEVVGGSYEYVDSDPNTDVTGYKSTGDDDVITLVLEGEVTPAGTATYWFKTGSGVFPATGPGLGCGDATAEFTLHTPVADGTPEGKDVAEPETGELLVLVYICTDAPEDRTGFDWFGECSPEGGVHDFTLTGINETGVEPVSMQSDASGDVTFGALDPGLYSLEMTDVTWCRAASDNVDAEGSVNIVAGERTTVWGFICQ